MHAQEKALENSSKNLHFHQTQTSLPETAGSTSAERLHKFKLKVYVICSVKCHSLFNPTSSVLGVYTFIHLVLLKIFQGGKKHPFFSLLRLGKSSSGVHGAGGECLGNVIGAPSGKILVLFPTSTYVNKRFISHKFSPQRPIAVPRG